MILYIGYEAHVPLRRRRLDGIRRCAKAHGWQVGTISAQDATSEMVRAAIRRLRPVGCVVECWMAQHGLLPPSFFGSLPAVYFNPPDESEWRGAAMVECDEAAVGQAAFEELSAALPPAYAAVDESWTRGRQWERGAMWGSKRIDAFFSRCHEIGKECIVFTERIDEDDGSRSARLAHWVAGLPLHCAIFATNDIAALSVAEALAAVGRSFPRSATIVGADNAGAPNDSTVAKSISSIRIDFELSGYLAAKKLAEMSGASATRPRVRPSCPSGPIDAAVFGPLLVERRQSTRGRGRREPWVLEAVDAIRREACDGLTAATLARRFPVSRNLFERRFREAMGHSVLDEIIHVRMQRVFDLLSRPDFPIGAIADFSGFGCGYGLRKIFHNRTGMSLREWRKVRL